MPYKSVDPHDPSMTLINLTVSSVNRSLVPLTVIQVETGLTFSELFAKLLAGSHPMIRVNEGMSGSCLEKVFVGQSKEYISVVDKQLILDDVCKLFGQHVKFSVVQLISPVEISDPQPLRNAFTVLMNSQRALDEKKLPSIVEARTRKDKDKFDQLRFLPDPIMGSDDHYLPFNSAYSTTLTTEIYRPSLKGKNLAKPLPFSSPSVQHALNTNIDVQCDECDMWNCI